MRTKCILLLFLFGCTSEQVDTENISVAKNFLEAYQKGNSEEAFKYCTAPVARRISMQDRFQRKVDSTFIFEYIKDSTTENESWIFYKFQDRINSIKLCNQNNSWKVCD